MKRSHIMINGELIYLKFANRDSPYNAIDQAKWVFSLYKWALQFILLATLLLLLYIFFPDEIESNKSTGLCISNALVKDIRMIASQNLRAPPFQNDGGWVSNHPCICHSLIIILTSHFCMFFFPP